MYRKLKFFYKKRNYNWNFFKKITKFFDFFIKKRFKKAFKKNQDKELLSELSHKSIPSPKQFKQIKHFLSEKERKIINICLVFLMIAFFWLVLRIIWNKLVELPKYGGEYTEGIVGSPQYINPVLAMSNDVDRDISRLIFSRLFQINKDGQIENDLVKDYSVSEDGKTYYFKLKDNILWHDGETLTSDDIGFTLSLIQDSNFKSPLYKTFQGIKFEKENESAFKLILPEKFAQFTSVLTFGILPAHSWENIGSENFTLAELNKKPIGSGPFKYESFKKDADGFIKQYKLEAFKDYYDKKAYLSEITFKFYGDINGVIDAINNGQINGVGSLSESEFSKIKNSKDYIFNNFNTPKYSALFFNPKQNGFLSNSDIRQALLLVIDKKRLASEIKTTEQEAYGPMDFIISPGTDEYDIDKAKKLLEDNGWEVDTEDNILKKKDQKLEFTITSVDNSEYIKILQYIKKQWATLGIVVNLEIIPANKISPQVIMPRQYQILLYGQLLSYDIDPYPFWHSSQTQNGLNLSLFGNSEIDAILESARKLSEVDDRLEQYKKFQEILKKENYAIFLFRPTYHYIVNKDLKGIDTRVVYISSDRFSNITNWYIKTKKAIKYKN